MKTIENSRFLKKLATFVCSILFLASLSFTLLLNSCSSDSSTPCVPITCLNGGTSTPNCGCDCPQGYSGPDCSTKKTPTKITISRIDVINHPCFTSSGAYWDSSLTITNSLYPDIYLEIRSNNVLIGYTSVLNDVPCSQTVSWVFLPAIEVNDAFSTMNIKMYDYDSASASDLMSNNDFYVYNSTTSGFPPTITLQNADNSVQVKLTLSYTF